MFDTMLESRKNQMDSKQVKATAGSAAVHIVVIAALVGGSYFVVEAVQDPDLLVSFIGMSAPPPPPPPPPPAAKKASTPRTEPVQPTEVVQPTIIPEQVQEAVEGGDDTGVEGGVEGGVVGGVEGGVSDEPLILTSDITPPELVNKVEPDYPEIAKRARIEGKVIVQIVVDESGNVTNVKVLRSIQMLDEAAIEAVKKWKYKPAIRSGKPVKVYVTVTVNFKLR